MKRKYDGRRHNSATKARRHLDLNNSGGRTTFAQEQRLDTDPVAKSLARIGDPATAAVGLILRDGDISARWRCTLVLMNINSVSSRELLRTHIAREKNQNLRKFIRMRLAESNAGGKI